MPFERRVSASKSEIVLAMGFFYSEVQAPKVDIANKFNLSEIYLT
jgi:hypothetical protein